MLLAAYLQARSLIQLTKASWKHRFSTMTLVDTHVHLWRKKDIPNLAWQSPGNPLYGVYDLPDYTSSISPPPKEYSGFVFVEADRKFSDPSDPSEEFEAWQHVVDEYRYVLNLSKDETAGKFVRGIVPFAPVHQGRVAMERYQKLLDAVDKEVYGDEKHGLLVGYRYLVQDKPNGTILKPNSIEGLKFIRDTGRVFELGVDTHRQGCTQFIESLEALSQVPDLKVVINHMTKPPLGGEPREGFGKWKELIQTAAGYKNVSVKLSGGFSELPPELDKHFDSLPVEPIVGMVKEYIAPIIKAFGLRRLIWGSDWPVCGIGYEKLLGHQKGAWQGWMEVSRLVVKQLQEEGGIDGDEQDWEGIWGKNAIQVYSLV